MFCPRCGTENSDGAAFCKNCGTALRTQWAASPSMRAQGSIGMGAVTGFVLMIVIGWIPVIGALIAGFVAGAVARGAWRGATAGFLAGILGGVISIVVFSILGLAFLGPLGGLIGIGAGFAILLLTGGSAVVGAIGGLVGGAVRRG